MSGFPKDLIITIDGPVAAGKTTAARLLSARLGYCHIDSGGMYRALAWKAMQEGRDLANPEILLDLLAQTRFELRPGPEGLRTLVDGEEVTDVLRLPKIGTAASIVSTHPRVRKEMVKRQRELGAQGGVVMDGRDIGTVVFPHAPVKFYLTASPEVRGRRRFQESPQETGDFDGTLAEVQQRDRRDMGRSASPLKPAADAILIDTTFVSAEEVVKEMEKHIRRKLKNSCDFFLA